mgnify:CR=1 FL=1
MAWPAASASAQPTLLGSAESFAVLGRTTVQNTGASAVTGDVGVSLAGVVKELGLFDFPFIVSTFEQAEALASGPFGKAMIETLPEKEVFQLEPSYQ